MNALNQFDKIRILYNKETLMRESRKRDNMMLTYLKKKKKRQDKNISADSGVDFSSPSTLWQKKK